MNWFCPMCGKQQQGDDDSCTDCGVTYVPEPTIKCARCGETRKTHGLWWGFRLAPGADVVCCLIEYESSTHSEPMGDGYYVKLQYCEHPWCDLYLGVNYPSSYCDDHR